MDATLAMRRIVIFRDFAVVGLGAGAGILVWSSLLGSPGHGENVTLWAVVLVPAVATAGVGLWVARRNFRLTTPTLAWQLGWTGMAIGLAVCTSLGSTLTLWIDLFIRDLIGGHGWSPLADPIVLLVSILIMVLFSLAFIAPKILIIWLVGLATLPIIRTLVYRSTWDMIQASNA